MRNKSKKNYYQCFYTYIPNWVLNYWLKTSLVSIIPLLHSINSYNLVNSYSLFAWILCRILGKQHFFWGWRRNWKPKNLKRMILLELSPCLVSVGLQCLIIFVMWYDCLCSCSSYILLMWSVLALWIDWRGMLEFLRWVLSWGS